MVIIGHRSGRREGQRRESADERRPARGIDVPELSALAELANRGEQARTATQLQAVLSAKELRVFRTPRMIENGLASLGKIAGELQANKGLDSDDVHLCLDADGTFAVQDADTAGRNCLTANLETIEELKAVLRKRLEWVLSSEEKKKLNPEAGKLEEKLDSNTVYDDE
jgi:hypothetical protein